MLFFSQLICYLNQKTLYSVQLSILKSSPIFSVYNLQWEKNPTYVQKLWNKNVQMVCKIHKDNSYSQKRCTSLSESFCTSLSGKRQVRELSRQDLRKLGDIPKKIDIRQSDFRWSTSACFPIFKQNSINYPPPALGWRSTLSFKKGASFHKFTFSRLLYA